MEDSRRIRCGGTTLAGALVPFPCPVVGFLGGASVVACLMTVSRLAVLSGLVCLSDALGFALSCSYLALTAVSLALTAVSSLTRLITHGFAAWSTCAAMLTFDAAAGCCPACGRDSVVWGMTAARVDATSDCAASRCVDPGGGTSTCVALVVTSRICAAGWDPAG